MFNVPSLLSMHSFIPFAWELMSSDHLCIPHPGLRISAFWTNFPYCTLMPKSKHTALRWHSQYWKWIWDNCCGTQLSEYRFDHWREYSLVYISHWKIISAEHDFCFLTHKCYVSDSQKVLNLIYSPLSFPWGK